jgi:flagellar biosynthesis/type III secretory pathway protein FliH
MAWTPQLNITCGRCGKPRGLRHVCVSNRNRKATVKPSWSFGECPKCRKRVTNPLTHTCRPKSDFKRRRAQHEKQQRAEAKATAAKERAGKRAQRPQHDYTSCRDGDCPRPLCVAFKTGHKTGHREGYEQGFQTGWDRGFPAGVAACPRTHK